MVTQEVKVSSLGPCQPFSLSARCLGAEGLRRDLGGGSCES